MLNPREIDVLNVLWKSDEPMMATEIVNSKRGLTQSTVTAVLRNMLRDKYVEVTGIKHSGRVLSRVYRPTELSKKAIIDTIVDTYSCAKDVVTIDEICAALKSL